MVIVDFVKRASRQDLRRMLILTVVAGFANALLVMVVNQVAGLVAAGSRPGLTPALMFIAAFAIYYQCDRLAVLKANEVIERLLNRLRTDIVDRLRCSELPVVDGIGRGSLYSILSQETNRLSVTFPLLVESFQQAVLLAASLVYLGYLSLPALVVFLIAVFAGVVGYWHIQKDFGATLKEIARRQAEMLDAIGDLIHGCKELRLNRRRSESVYRAYEQISHLAEGLLTRSGNHSASMILLGSLVVYSMLGIVGFIFPQYAGTRSTIVFQLIAPLLFCMMALVRIAGQSPMFVQTDVGLKTILGVERELESGGSITPQEARELATRYRNFRDIGYAGITFSYRDASGAPVFTAGPWDFRLTRGETVFLVGGNGSGKSTALRLITGLYRADRGEIDVNGIPVRGRETAGLRELFSAIFVDFHLFDRLYGLEDVDPAQVRHLIDEMELTGKVSFEDGRFTDLHLSTGQRKRLALIAAVLENRPIYVFDEWAAEQDVHFREAFYSRIIPALKAKGKTVVAVTHDDRYWHVADRVIKLDLGSVVWERAGAELT